VLDGLGYKRHATHFTLPEAAQVAQELGAQVTFLTHMTHTVDYHEASAALPPGVAPAFDGLQISF
jgi:phosphoribosyl 1,2-cyclic phosphate phosphodiesterase